jgi:hypothetical protein
MIIFNRDTKNLSIPKGLGNVSVAVTSGNTDTVSPADLEAALSEERVAIAAQTNEIVGEAAENLTASYQSADRQVLSDANAYADSAITAAIEESEDKYTFVCPYGSQYWNYFSADVTNAIFNKADALGTAATRMKVWISGWNYGVWREFSVARYENRDTLYLQWTGIDYGSIHGGKRRITCDWLTLTRDTAVGEGGIYEFYITDNA